jgi:NAD(P)-dependent dehydrogenase (short-subunit alcohol dehydrogenase family)
VRVNCISPGIIDVRDSTRHLISKFPNPTKSFEEGRNTDSSQFLKGRRGNGGDVARLAWWLCQEEESGFITGQDIAVDGGLGKMKL